MRVVRSLDGVLATVAFYPYLLVAYIVLQLYAANGSEVPLKDALIALLIALAITAIGYAIAWALYRDARRAAIVVGLSAVLAMGFGHLRQALHPHWSDDGLLLLLACVAGVMAVGVAARRARVNLGPLTQAMNVASVLALAVASVPILSFAGATLAVPAGLGSDALPPVVRAASYDLDPAQAPRDIYYLVFDRYGSERAIELRHGFDNSDFVDWLRDRDFAVMDHARANYDRSTFSLGSTLSMAMLDDIAARMASDNRVLDPVLDRLRNSRAAAFLQDLGYRYTHIGSWYGPTRDSAIADRTIGPSGHRNLAETILDLSALGGLGRRASIEAVHAESAEFQFEQLWSIAEEPGPKLIVAHFLLPHDPYVYLEDGTLDPVDATYVSQLQYTNTRIRSLVEQLLDRPEAERPIIILQADEGPYPERLRDSPDGYDWATATPDEVAVKFGILNAMYLPGPLGDDPLPSTLSSVNTFREVLRRYFGADLPRLPDRSYGSTAGSYHFVDVTDRLDQLTESRTAHGSR